MILPDSMSNTLTTPDGTSTYSWAGGIGTGSGWDQYGGGSSGSYGATFFFSGTAFKAGYQYQLSINIAGGSQRSVSGLNGPYMGSDFIAIGTSLNSVKCVAYDFTLILQFSESYAGQDFAVTLMRSSYLRAYRGKVGSTSSTAYGYYNPSYIESLSYDTKAVYVSDEQSSDGIIEAIENQTQQEQQQHDETMGKLDDMTSFDDEEQSSMTGDLDGQQQVFEEKLGILSFADQLIEQLLGLFEEDTSARGLVFPAFNLSVGGESYPVWQQQVFDLSSLDTWVGDLMTVVRFATSFLVWAALVAYIQKIFSALVEDWSDR